MIEKQLNCYINLFILDYTVKKHIMANVDAE